MNSFGPRKSIAHFTRLLPPCARRVRFCDMLLFFSPIAVSQQFTGFADAGLRIAVAFACCECWTTTVPSGFRNWGTSSTFLQEASFNHTKEQRQHMQQFGNHLHTTLAKQFQEMIRLLADKLSQYTVCRLSPLGFDSSRLRLGSGFVLVAMCRACNCGLLCAHQSFF